MKIMAHAPARPRTQSSTRHGVLNRDLAEIRPDNYLRFGLGRKQP